MRPIPALVLLALTSCDRGNLYWPRMAVATESTLQAQLAASTSAPFGPVEPAGSCPGDVAEGERLYLLHALPDQVALDEDLVATVTTTCGAVALPPARHTARATRDGGGDQGGALVGVTPPRGAIVGELKLDGVALPILNCAAWLEREGDLFKDLSQKQQSVGEQTVVVAELDLVTSHSGGC